MLKNYTNSTWNLKNAKEMAKEKILQNPDTTFVPWTIVIDHLLVNSLITVKRYEVIKYKQSGGSVKGEVGGHIPSDHLAIIIDIEVN